YAFQVDWLNRMVATVVKADFIKNFESGCAVPPGSNLGCGYDGNVIIGNNLPTGTGLPLRLMGDFGGYLRFSFQRVLYDAANYCQTLVPNCTVTSDEGPTFQIRPNNGYTNYHGYGLQGAPSSNSWVQTYGTNVEGIICSSP